MDCDMGGLETVSIGETGSVPLPPAKPIDRFDAELSKVRCSSFWFQFHASRIYSAVTKWMILLTAALMW
jgi:hypothetical protein